MISTNFNLQEIGSANLCYKAKNEPVDSDSKNDLVVDNKQCFKSAYYRPFKGNSTVTDPNSVITTKNIKPTGGPIIHFNDKNGEKFMAREVIINGDTKAFAVSNVKSPSQATLMNAEVFEKYMLENLPEINK
ncbi:MAG: hypothetical protein E7Z92_07195 [Cyanobacteria bacterium SIG31]|nr:hypothetical protein [Cyanobacteria bacterium SIG31]